MKKLILIAAAALFTVNMAMAGEGKGKGPRDPKMMTAKVSEKLDFTDAQKGQLKALNEKYPGADYDKMKYREEFRTILTDGQKARLDEMKKKRAERMKK